MYFNLRSGFKAQDTGIPDTMVSKILFFIIYDTIPYFSERTKIRGIPETMACRVFLFGFPLGPLPASFGCMRASFCCWIQSSTGLKGPPLTAVSDQASNR